MVRIIITSLISVFLLVGVVNADPEEPLTGNKLREILNKSEREHSDKERNLKYDEVHKIFDIRKKESENKQTSATGQVVGADLKTNKEEPNPDGNTPIEDRLLGNEGTEKSKPTTNTLVGVKTKPKSKRAGVRKSNDRYVPPSWKVMQNTGDFAVDQVKAKGPKFGVRIGTRMRGEIRRPVTNAERNMCEIYLTEDVIGDHETLERGSIIFATKQFNKSTKLLEMRATNGITKDGREFRLSAYAMDVNEVAGLSGTITTDGNTAKRSMSEGGFEVGRSVISTLEGGNPIGAGVVAATENVLDEKEQETQIKQGEPQFIIRVAPQKLILMVDKTF